MDPWVWWLISAAVLIVAEILTTSLVFAMLTGGAVAGVVVAALGGGVGLEVGAFAIVSLALLVVVRPIALNHLHTPTKFRSGMAALVGAEAEVLETVDPRDGRIRLSGEIWSARSYDGESVLAPGTLVRVVEIAGATALVI